MKKSILLLVILMITFSSLFAQSGKSFLEGSASFTNINYVNEVYHSYNISPMAGYYVSDKLALGAGLSFGGNNYVTQYSSSTYSLGITPFIRYRFLEIGNFAVIGESDLNFNYTDTKYYYATSSVPSYFGYYLLFKPGFEYKITDRISLNSFFGSLEFSHNNSPYSYFTANLTSGLGLAFIYYMK